MTTKRTRVLGGVVVFVLVLVGAFGFLMRGKVVASPRGAIEICGNGQDDDGDGYTDETGANGGGCYAGAGTPISDDGIVPELWEDNPSCEDLGFGYGFKIEGQGAAAYTGEFTFTSDDGILTGGAPEDSSNSVTLSSDGTYLAFTSTLPLDAVFMKAGPGGNAYVYDPEDSHDSGLAGPNAASALSHVEFCYDYELTAEKTANAEYTRTYTWEITKTVTPESHTGWFGDEFTSSYDVEVDRTDTDSDFKVTGVISISNPTPWVVGFTVSDTVSDTVNSTLAQVTCPDDDYTLDPGETKVCSYVADLGDEFPDLASGTNIATVTSEDTGVDGAEATADYTFGEPTTIVGYPTINVKDYFDGDIVGDPLGAASGYFTFEFDHDFACPTDTLEYTDGVFTDSFPNTAEIDETGQSDDANVDLTCYAPVVEKDATPAWEEFYDWDIFKNVDNTEFVGFVGEEWLFNYDIDVTLTTYDQRNFSASGTISVTNPHPNESMVVSLTDAVNGFTGVIELDADCSYLGGDLTVPADSTATCGYTVDMGDDLDGGQEVQYTNTATATLGGGSFIGTADFTFGDVDPTLGAGSEPAEVTATDDNATSGDTGDDHHSTTIRGTTADVITYTQAGECPTETVEYTDGFYEVTLTNRADIDQTTDWDTKTVTVTCYAPVVEKDVTPAWEEFYDWDIFKNVDNTEFVGFVGEEWLFNYDIDVTLTTYDQRNFSASGTISVTNSNPDESMVVGLSDAVNGFTGEIVADADCDYDVGTGELTIPLNSTATCGYTVDMGDDLDGQQATEYTNTATATLDDGVFTGSATFTFGDVDPTLAEGSEPAEVTATDDNATDDDDTDDHHSTTITATTQDVITYTQAGECPTETVEYEDGFYELTLTNVADIDQTTDSVSKTVTVNCYAPVPSKTAAGTYDERHEWEVEKTVTPLTQGGYPGDVLGWTWTVTPTETVFEENFVVSGTITVKNYNPESAMAVSLVDYVDGTMATLDCGGTLEVPAAIGSAPGEADCDYSASFPSIADDVDAPTLNTVTATLNSIGFGATADIAYTANHIRENATLTDTEIALTETLQGHTQAGTYTFGPYTGDDSHTCESSRDDYFEDGVYTQITDTIVNWAYVYSDGEEQDKDDATTTWTCDASFVDILKTTNGEVDREKDIRFRLYDSDGTYLDDEVSTFGDEDGQLQFQTALVPGDGYTICEAPVPAGYTFEITVENGGNVLTYAGPPGAVDPTGEIQCFDFTAAEAGNTLLFYVNNSYPGGAPRTPGYWKNWSTCSGGNQAETAEKLGGVSEGVFLLDDLLPQTIGDFTIETREVGVLVLDSRTVDKKEKNMSNDAAYTLAKALLAARLNQDAGACVVPPEGWWNETEWGEQPAELQTFEQVLTAADQLLIDEGFDGTGDYLGPKNKQDKDLAAYALWLYEIIDDYNNSEICTGDPSH